jgi:hypothetical protein
MADGNLVVLDFDDTLFLTFDCISAAVKEITGRSDLNKEQVRALAKPLKSQIYRLAYSKYRDLQRPNMALFEYLKANRAGSTFIVMTANLSFSEPEVLRSTMEIIRKLGLDVKRFETRADAGQEDEEWKAITLDALAAEYQGSRIEIFEDKIDNIEYIRGHVQVPGISFFLVENDRIRRV